MSSDLKVTNIKHESSSSNNLVLGSDGSATINQISSSSVFPAGGTGNPISVAVIADEKSATTNGGGSSTGSFIARELNTVISDTEGSNGTVTLSSSDPNYPSTGVLDQFTLSAGTYLISWRTPAYTTYRHQSQLYDVTGPSALAEGSSEFAFDDQTFSVGSFVHTITTNNTYEIRHRHQNAVAGNGLGVESNHGVNCVYTSVVISKLK